MLFIGTKHLTVMNSYRANEMLLVSRLIQKEFATFNSNYLPNSTKKQHFEILEKKMKDRPLRAYFSYKLHDYLRKYAGNEAKNNEEFFIRQLPFILETIISIQYYHNQILDRKGGVNTHLAINDNLILGNLLKDQFYRYLESKEIKLNKGGKHKLIEHVRSIFEYVDIGQYMEKHCNVYAALQDNNIETPFQKKVEDFIDQSLIAEAKKIINKVLEVENEGFLNQYLTRIKLTNAALFTVTVQLIGNLLDIGEKKRKTFERFASFFGIMQQIVNDNCDLVPSIYTNGTKAKKRQDALSDLKNKCITLPLLIHLQRSPNGLIAEYLKSEKNKFNEDFFFKEVVEKHSIFYSMSMAKKMSKKIIGETEEQEKQMDNGLKDLWSIAENNRFYKHFYNHNSGNCYKEYQKRKKKQKQS